MRTGYKIICILLLVLIAAAVFTGCSGSEKVELSNPDFESGSTASGGVAGYEGVVRLLCKGTAEELEKVRQLYLSVKDAPNYIL